MTTNKKEVEGEWLFSLLGLPLKMCDFKEEQSNTIFDNDVGHDQKWLDLIRRIDFGWAVEKDAEKKSKKHKTAAKETTAAQAWPSKSVVENLHSAHQELSVIIDLINTVEANDAVAVAGMTRPKPLPNEVLSDLSVSAATKLQCFRKLGKYFKQSAKALEQQVAREARFYGALIRLQRNWKVKRPRLPVSSSSNEGFIIDLFDNSLSDSAALYRPPSLSGVHIEHNSAGVLAVNLPPNSCRSIHFGFRSGHLDQKLVKSIRTKANGSSEHPLREVNKEPVRDDDVDVHVKEAHSTLRKVHRAIFDEQVFDLVNREAFNSSPGVNVTALEENHLKLDIGQGASMFLSLLPFGQDSDQNGEFADSENSGTDNVPSDTVDSARAPEEKAGFMKELPGPSPVCFEIYLQQIFHDNLFVKLQDRRASANRTQRTSGDRVELLLHFCKTLAHRIFSSKVLAQLESLASKLPYLHLLSNPTWHSCTSSWTLSIKVAQSILHAGDGLRLSDSKKGKSGTRLQFQTKVVVTDDRINIEGEGAPNVVGLFRGGSEEICHLNSYDCDLSNLSMILLQQVASQVVRWLYEEALRVGMKVSQDFLCLSLELEQGDRLCLVARVNPKDTKGCISWWLLMADSLMEEGKAYASFSHGKSENMRFLGYLSLETLYSTLMDLVSLCNAGGYS
ncbi:hypothetical protein Scep_008430 [Stephania cephalantha]|uniref:Mediator of RNA polymerase II transcription subunit 17 n=1 Tax=Stephania cephalantha TaxID=152367 RepID=A0AAP0KDG0_9MAGN